MTILVDSVEFFPNLDVLYKFDHSSVSGSVRPVKFCMQRKIFIYYGYQDIVDIKTIIYDRVYLTERNVALIYKTPKYLYIVAFSAECYVVDVEKILNDLLNKGLSFEVAVNAILLKKV